MPRARLPRETRTCPVCGDPFETRADLPQLCCSRPCARKRDNKLRPKAKPRICPCGKEIEAPEYHESRYAHNRKYCSDDCRKTHGKKKQPNPENYITFDCLNCGKEVTRYKNYGKGHNKYCSNSCSRRHTKTKQHIVVDDAVVLDSGYEAFFWGLCQLVKLPIERYDRGKGVEWREGCWYAPDFYLPSLDLSVELKGLSDGVDTDRWEAFREQRGPVIVLYGDDLRDMTLGRTDLTSLLQP